MALKTLTEALGRCAGFNVNHFVEALKAAVPAAHAQATLEIAEINFAPSFGGIVYTSKDDDGCRKVEERVRLGPICRRPDYRRKPIPPFQYGYCKEEEEELPQFCPPQKKKSAPGPRSCCKLNDEKQCE